MLLQVVDVVVYYEKAISLRGVSLAITEGEIVTVLGANGAGKSTLLRSISGIKTISSGEIWFDGQRIDGLEPKEIVALGVIQVPEGRGVFPDMSVYENLRIGAYLRKDKKEIKSDLDKVYEYLPVLKERAGQRAGSLSGGEQQLLVIGRALMSKPKLLLMDEPSLGLAPLMTREIARIMVNLNEREGLSMLLVEQNARLGLQLSERAYIFETGSIALEGNTKVLVDNEYVKKVYLGM